MTKIWDRIIQGGLVVLRDEVRRLDLGIRDGRIAAMADRLEADGVPVWNASGCYVLPGMVDVHVHFNEPNLGHWEGFRTGSAALAAGGCTTYVDMPLNGVPPTVSVEALKLKLERAAGQSYVDYALWGGLMPGKLEHIEALADSGVIGFKAFMSEPGGDGEDIFERSDDYTLLEGMKRIAAVGGILALHAESEPIVAALVREMRRAGRTLPRDYAASRPAIAELEAVRRALFYAEQTGCRLHFVHISTSEAVAAIRQARRQGLDVTVETCPHYLALTEDDMARIGAVAKCAPPLRGALEQERLWNDFSVGGIDIIASDHSPSPPELKAKADFFAAWGGISGAQSSMELMLGEGVVRRNLPIEQIARALSYEPAKRFGLHPRKGEIIVGADADLAVVNLGETYTLQAQDLHYLHKHSPYVGRTMFCKVKATFSRGRLVYDAAKGIVGEPQGEWIRK
jgi:allantoinase